ncbi:MAG: hypothetical protein LAN63_09160 [Acidobacteriia bacterium]|nr:hypothetical protein [Terriglobia bacterium]
MSSRWTKVQTILGVIVLTLCGIWQVGVCGGQTADPANSGLRSSGEAAKTAIPHDAKDSPPGAQATLGASPNQSTTSLTPISPSVTLTWTASVSASKASPDPVKGYNVYRGTTSHAYDPKPINAAPVEDTTYVDLSVEVGQKYFYAVKTVTVKGVESVPSNEAEADFLSH